MWKKGNPCTTAGGNVSWCSHHGNIWRFLKKLKIELPCDPEIPFLSIYQEKKKKTLIQKDTCTPMFIVALFTIAKTGKQLKCPSTDEWIKKMWHIYTVKHCCFSVTKLSPTLFTQFPTQNIKDSASLKERKNVYRNYGVKYRRYYDKGSDTTERLNNKNNL